MILGLVYDLAKCETPSICYDMAEISLPSTVLEHLDDSKCHTLSPEHFLHINLLSPQDNNEVGSATIYFVFVSKEMEVLTE